jgi:hypothetical protein
MSSSINHDMAGASPLASLLKLMGDSFIPIPWAHAGGGGGTQTTRTSLKDGGSYPSAPPGYSEAFGSGAKYLAFRLGATLFINAEGTLGNANEYADVRQAPIRIYPPAFDFLVYSPQITLPATRKFNFTVRVGYPTEPRAVQVRDAQGSHQIEIKDLPLSGALAGLAGSADAAGEGFGMGDSIEEAVSAAIATLPAKPSPMPDALYAYKIIESGKVIGGFVGLNVYYARVTLTSR